jgi:uncharacterized protein YndB with AHSA1/START domain
MAMPADANEVTASVVVNASPEVVYEYFIQPDAMVRWLGQFARLDPRPGGELAIDMGGTPVRGRYQELEPPSRIVFTWGVAGSDELPPGSSTVEVRLSEEAGGTRVDLVHRDLPAHERPKHAAGWRHRLGLLAIAAG